jgi:Raf kinase inhibitor-like YbhB/YbcL family protein
LIKPHIGDLSVTSSAFIHAERIPDRFTGDGEGISPPLAWKNVPDGTESFAIICSDPDAPLTYGFTHWVLYNIPQDVRSIDAGEDSKFTAGANGAGKSGYYPPTPLPGHGDHFYYFHLYALDAMSPLEPGLDSDKLLARVDDHILVQARLVGRYSRP